MYLLIYTCIILYIFKELTYLDFAYHHLLQNMDDGSRRFKKYKDASKISALSQTKVNDVDQTQSSNQPTAVSFVENYRDEAEDYKAQFKKSVLKKSHTNPTANELNLVRDHMRQFNSSEHDFFSMFQNYFDEYNPKFAVKFQYMLNTDGDEVIKWMKNSLLPFGKQLVDWCDGGRDKTLDQSLYCCNGNLSLHD